MSYQVLARKWRPKTFQQLVGQEHVVTVLVNALAQQRLHHAYLFTGTRGVGKTTIARIFAKSLNCLTGITATPCGECGVCKDIDQGRFIDLLEVDAASRTKVDDTREILDNVQYAPTSGRYKVYLIDEVHMLSRSSFNALLKTLEEPPEHVKFILATTEPHKIPATVLSRCLQFHLKALSVDQIEQKLTQILTAEKVSYAAGALTLLAKAARGSMRDGLSLTDQAIAQGRGDITLANLRQMLGGVDQNWVYKILIALLKQDASDVMLLSQEIASYAPNYGRVFAEFLQLLHQIAMYQVVKQHLDLSSEHAALLVKFSQYMSAEDIQLYYQIVLHGRKDLPYAADEASAFDMVLLRLLAFKPMQSGQQVGVVEHKQTTRPGDFEQESLPSSDVSQTQAAPAVQVDELVAELVAEQPIQSAAHQSQDPQQILAQEMQQIESSAIEQGKTALPEHANALTQVFAATKPQSDGHGVNPDVPGSALPHQTVASNTSTLAAPQNLSRQADNSSEQYNQQSYDQASYDQVPYDQPGYDQAPYSNQEYRSEQNSPSPANQPVSGPAPTSVDAILATRNMLRSRKRQSGQAAKKSDGALTRHGVGTTGKDADTAQQQISTPQSPGKSVPALATLPDQAYSPALIDPAKMRLANEVDKWANMIDTMELSGRLRQLAIHATISDTSSEDRLVLLLDQSTKHLKTEVAQQQLIDSICQYLARPVTVVIDIVQQTVADPYQIQSHINDKRHEYAKALILADDFVLTLQTQFQAQLDENTLSAC